MAALAQATQQGLSEGPVAEEVLPCGIWHVGRDERWFPVMPLLHELEEDVCLLWFYVEVPEFIDER